MSMSSTSTPSGSRTVAISTSPPGPGTWMRRAGASNPAAARRANVASTSTKKESRKKPGEAGPAMSGHPRRRRTRPARRCRRPARRDRRGRSSGAGRRGHRTACAIRRRTRGPSGRRGRARPGRTAGWHRRRARTRRCDGRAPRHAPSSMSVGSSGLRKVMPPSATSTWPVTQSSSTNATIALAMSSAVPKRPSAARSETSSR